MAIAQLLQKSQSAMVRPFTSGRSACRGPTSLSSPPARTLRYGSASRLLSTKTRVSAKSSTKLERKQSVDELLLNGPAENALCGLFLYQEEQLKIVEEFTESMKGCAFAFGLVSAATVVVTLVQAGDNGSGPEVLFNGVTVGDVAYWGDSLLVALLMNYTAASFERIPQAGGAAMAHTFSGINRLAVTFQQLALGAVAVGTVSILESAIKWPVLVKASSVLFFLFALVRSAAMWYLMTNEKFKDATYSGVPCRDYAARAGWADRWAIKIAFGYIAIFEQKEKGPEHQETVASTLPNLALMTTEDGRYEAYEFSSTEERMLKVLVDAGNTLALAMYFQAVATGLLVLADAATGDYSEVVTDMINVLNKAVAATLIIKACDSFDLALYTEGSDVEHLLNGLGEESLTKLFHSLSVLAWGVAFTSVLLVLIPLVEESPVVRGMSEGASHLVGDFIVEGLGLLKAAVRLW